jgi:hypothetical protein
MRRLAFAALLLSLVTSTASAEAFSVKMDQSARLTLPAGARDVMVGNPAIIDVNVIDGRNLVVLGRGYGSTNILVIDTRGRTILDQQVTVVAADEGRVTVIRGQAAGGSPTHAENYGCAPGCERTPMPGELQSEFGKYTATRPAGGGGGGDAAKPAP